MTRNAAFCGLFVFLSLAYFEVPSEAADLTGSGGKVVTLPTIPPLTRGPLTNHGAIDFALQYQTHGEPLSGAVHSSPGMITPAGRQSKLVLAPNQSYPSFVDIKIEQGIAHDLNFVAKAETGFFPTRGQLDDALKGLQRQTFE